jgi:hypothetical protein
MRGSEGPSNITVGKGDPKVPPTLTVSDISQEVHMLQKACQPLYHGAKFTMFASTLLLMNVCK